MNQRFEPPAGGRERLLSKLNESDRQERRDLQTLSLAASMLLVALGALLLESYQNSRILERISATSPGALEIPIATPGVRFFVIDSARTSVVQSHSR